MYVTHNIVQLAEFLAAVLGDHTEVVVHDLTDLSCSVIAIFNGHITRRSVGAAATDLGLRLMRECLGRQEAPFRVNYAGKTIDGRTLRSSSMVLRDAQGQPAAMLCINSDDSRFDVAMAALRALMPVREQGAFEALSMSSIEQVGEQILADVLAPYPVDPATMSQDEKKAVVQQLDQSGLFMVKGFVARTAGILGVSEPTVYRYLKD
ncbi:PAS domain-containing protein [Jeongeupia wiesaeckerbachi]|uniref:helix-turn-helix transcriptional regulator n=1 Tax=Jeongeupia wiesaeckerbachi TaxID=3051218 RepID=UPI003D80323A